MKNMFIVAVACGLALSACGKVNEMKQAAEQATTIAKAASKAADAVDESQKAMEARRAKGDTVAMPYKDLEGYLPSSIDGFRKSGDPSGAQQSMTGFSMSTAEQKWVGNADSSQELTVTLADYGGTEGAATGLMAAFSMGYSMDNDEQRVEPVKTDLSQTKGMLTYTKQSHECEVHLASQYRYGIDVKLSGVQDDQSKMVTDVATDVAKKFVGK